MKQIRLYDTLIVYSYKIERKEETDLKKFRALISVILCLIIACSSAAVCYAINEDPMALKQTSVKKDINAPMAEAEQIIHAEKFKDNYEIYDLIDVSVHNSTINWDKVLASGVKNVMIRVGYRGYQTGSLNIDTAFERNIQGATKAGLNVGVYFYSQAINRKEAIEEADYAIQKVAGYNLKLPIAFDCEYAEKNGGFTGRLYDAKLTKDELTSICLAFCNRVSSAGYDGMVYASATMFTDHMNADSISTYYDIWLAHYTSCTNYAGDYCLWQYTSKGSVDGITGNVDRNYLYVKKDDGTKEPKYLRVTTSVLDLYVNYKAQLYTFKDEEAIAKLGGTVSDIKWSSSDNAVLTVDNTGVITAVAEGRAEITAEFTVKLPEKKENTSSETTTTEDKAEEKTEDVLTIKDSVVIDVMPVPVVTPPADGGEGGSGNSEGGNSNQQTNVFSEILQSILSMFMQLIQGLLGVFKSIG